LGYLTPLTSVKEELFILTFSKKKYTTMNKPCQILPQPETTGSMRALATLLEPALISLLSPQLGRLHPSQLPKVKDMVGGHTFARA
jgi:hypothetical protein